MAIALTSDSAKAAGRAPNLMVLAVTAWAFFSILMLLHLFVQPSDLFLSSDDTMRLAQMRDFMAGQSWFDTTQTRMNAPFGLVMHWPHFVDAALTGLVVVLRPLLGAQAELGAVRLWPLLTALPVFLAVTRIGAKLAGREGGIIALVLMATCVAALGTFVPGRIDHHNVQLALCLWMAACLIEEDRPWLFAVAAPLGAFSLAIGLETLPYVLTASLFATGLAVADGKRFDASARGFGFAFAGTAALLFTLAPDAERHLPSCDAYSLFYAPIAVAGGLGLAALTFLPASPRLRFAGAFGLAIALLGLAFATNRTCLGGPYAQVDPALDALWLSRIEEAQPAWRFAFQEPAYFFAGYLYAVFCFIATVTACALSGDMRRKLLVMALLTGSALTVATLEVRGVTFTCLLGIPGVAALMVFGLRRIEKLKVSKAVQLCLAMAMLIGASDVAFDGVGKALLKSLPPLPLARDGNALACIQADTLSRLDALPAGTVAAFVDQGPRILAYSRDSAIAGPYHRDAQGIIDINSIFAGAPDSARAVLTARKASYVLSCSGSPDYRFYIHENKNGLLAQLDRGAIPSWLKPVALRDPHNVLRLYRVAQ
jgi:hypothetical protein